MLHHATLSIMMSYVFSTHSNILIKSRPMSLSLYKGPPRNHPSGHYRGMNLPMSMLSHFFISCWSSALWQNFWPMGRGAKLTHPCHPTLPLESQPQRRTLKTLTHPHYDTCHGVAHLGHEVQRWWRADIMSLVIVHSNAYLGWNPCTSFWQAVICQHGASILCSIDTKSDKLASFTHMHLTLESLVKIHDGTLTSESMV